VSGPFGPGQKWCTRPHHLHGPPPCPLPAGLWQHRVYAAATSIADRNDELPVPHVTLRPALVSRGSDDEVRVPLACSTSTPFVGPLPSLQAGGQFSAYSGILTVSVLLLP
jgi:hypothetical protein